MATTEKKEIRYLNKDFFSFRESLMNFAKVYYPNTYKDFSETSPGMMFIEMASYIGDVLAYYTDRQFKESLVYYSEEPSNISNIAQTFGYVPKPISPATADLDVFQLVPALSNAPDWKYATKIRAGMRIKSTANANVEFRTLDDADFTLSGSADLTISVYSVTSGTPDWFLLKKTVKVNAGILKTETFTFGDPQKFSKILLTESDITEVVSVTDSDGYTWYEVPYLAQDTIAVSVPNTAVYDPTLSIYYQDTPYLLKLKKVPRRFETRYRGDSRLEFKFGSGISDSADEEITPNVSMLGSTLPDGTIDFSQNIDPANFLFTKTYGQIPHNTTMTVQYYHGGGAESNVGKDDLTEILEMTVDLNETTLDANLVTQVKASIACTNPSPATGGRGAESPDEIRLNALASFSSQNRAVTKEDYIIRALSMPAKFGSIAKVYVVPDSLLNASKDGDKTTNSNPFKINMYVIGYDQNGNLTNLNEAVLRNLSTYIGQYRLLTDAINIENGFIINIGIDFKIVVLPKYNQNEVVLGAIQAVKDFFNIQNWQFNQPILIYALTTAIASVQGVQSIVGNPVIKCLYKASDGYSGNIYNITEATYNNVIYPSLDPAIFEVKFPDLDIRCSVTTY